MMNESTLERYRDLVDADEFERLADAVQRPLSPAIRINTLKIDVAEARRTWPAWYDWPVREVAFCDAGWQVDSDEIVRTVEHRMGFYYIQEAASMLPVEMFSFGQDEPLVLDMAAAPGGKSTHLACKLNDRGLLIANDCTGHRIPPLCDKLQDWGVMNYAVTTYPGERFGEWFPETFDKVLVDAPCSGQSLRWAVRRKPGGVSPKIRRAFHQQQLALLLSAFHAVKPGGEVVYATCTLAPEEDEAVLDAFLGLYPQQATIEPVDHVLPVPAPALDSDGEHAFHPHIRRAVRLWPHLYDTAGFFAALIRKRDSVESEIDFPPARPLEAARFTRLDRQEAAGVSDRLLQVYGFELAPVLGRQALTLWRHEDAAYAIPQQFLDHLADLPCVVTGMQIGAWGREGFVPSHELVARFGDRFTGRRLVLAEEQAAVWNGGRDLRGVETQYSSGEVILLYDERGRFLGQGKVLKERIRNLLPRRSVY